ncbi:hypothetical protein EXU85_20435 [Spirosoma sp. KCTC 42546]|uniref:hypothetical protein n=1 Tax=Spirosoma sp. KCTC 42546 TaxID=2520506 RepID=UPI001157B7AB|nr:hypothetical protein [Spirosoma sp. KCTC 42546]QDK80848.1 hypothetical protein EXU85_20435 [Spirosoma sp. KCTC 42546]
MSSRKFSITDWNNRHFKQVEDYARRIDLIYLTAVQEAVQIAQSVEENPDKQFSFDDYPRTKDRIDSLIQRMALNMILTIDTGMVAEWGLANDQNDALIESVFSSTPQPRQKTEPVTPPARYLDRNEEALKAFRIQKVGGMTLSDRVWNYTSQFKGELEMAIDVGLGQGRSAAQLSMDIRKYLNKPDRLFRKVRDKRGNLGLSKVAKNYHPGQGIYRSSYKNAMRLTRTEINSAYREADHLRYQQLDFVVGIEVRRSNHVFSCDVCESLKGRYPKTFKFKGWHQQCRCHAISILATPEELQKLTGMILNGEDPSTLRSVNEITDLPEGFTRWVSDNQDRLNRAKQVPYFISDNFKNRDLSKATFTRVLPKADPKAIDLSKFIAGDVPTNKELKAVIMEFARTHPENFRSGLESVSILHSKSYLLQHSQLYTPYTNQWKGQSTISISTHSFSLGGSTFNPAEELRGAFGAMKAQTPLTFNQEYAVEGLWHEILHAKSKTPPRKLNKYALQDMETLNQFTARHTYDEFLKPFGVKPIHKTDILDKGYGYSNWVTNIRSTIAKRGLSEQQVVSDLLPILLGDYAAISKGMADYFKKHPLR